MTLDYLGEPNIITRLLKRKGDSEGEWAEPFGNFQRDVTPLPSKMEEEGPAQWLIG